MNDAAMIDVAGLSEWERPDYIAAEPTGVEWIDALRERHLAALDEFQKSVASVSSTEADVEARNRTWRRAVRNAVAAGDDPPPPEQSADVTHARVQVAQEDTAFARDDLALTACEVLAEIRRRRDEFDDHFYGASEALRRALLVGPDGMPEAERQRQARRAAIAAEPSLVDVDDPANAPLTQLGEQRSSSAT